MGNLHKKRRKSIKTPFQNMQEHLFKVSRTARYYTLGTFDEHTRSLWFVLHGYGQLAQFFIRKFVEIQDQNTFVVAPEAISRFYLNETYSRVGASWMTKDLRQSEIEEYVEYLNQLYDTLCAGKDLSGVQINILGFSQGCATACRWLDAGPVTCDRLLLWAGFFNNGIREVIDPQKLKNTQTYYIYGDQDEFLVAYPEVATQFKKTMMEEVNPEIITFQGGHFIHEPTLAQIVANWR
jgi:predicted esterase